MMDLQSIAEGLELVSVEKVGKVNPKARLQRSQHLQTATPRCKVALGGTGELNHCIYGNPRQLTAILVEPQS